MFQQPDESIFVQKVHVKLSVILFLLIIDSIIYYLPYRNNVHIGYLFGVSLWLYFGILNAILVVSVYVFVKGEVILDFEKKEFSFQEFNRSRTWSFAELMGIYLLASEGKYIIRLRPQRLLILDIRVKFEQAYKLLDKFEAQGYRFKSIRPDPPKRLNYTIPLLLSKYEKKPSGFNPEFINWYRGMTMRTKLISITMSPMLYIIAATLVLRIPHLLEGLSLTRGFVSFLYGLTAFILFDGGLYFLFGVSIIVILAKQISKFTSETHSSDKNLARKPKE
ncbi:MAG: hypothetical protein V3V41_07810 [Candidatus Heimdallarchaeota archaeon]